MTTEFYGHLAAHYLKKEVERLTFGPPAPVPTYPAPTPIAAQTATSPPHVPQEPRSPHGRAPSIRRVAVGRNGADLTRSGREDSNLRHSAPKFTRTVFQAV
jgi:hypothetical protein